MALQKKHGAAFLGHRVREMGLVSGANTPLEPFSLAINECLQNLGVLC